MSHEHRNRHNGSARRRNKMAEIEREFDEPFWDVVQGLADMGFGKYGTADAIGYDRSAFCRLIRDIGGHVVWPAYQDLRVWRDREYPEGWAKSISKGRRQSGKGLRVVDVDGQQMLQRDYARMTGISETTAWRRRRGGKIKEAA